MNLKKYLRIKAAGLSIYIFCTLVVYLGGVYFGGILLFFFYCLLFFPILSIALLIAGTRGLRYMQLFSTDHPVKGESIEYGVRVSNESLAPISQVKSVFVRVSPLATLTLPDFSFAIGGRKSRELSYTIACTYRGIYHVGLESILVTDLTGFCTIRLGVWHRTFYVYPQVVRIASLPFTSESFVNMGTKSTAGGFPDNTLVNTIREYRRHDPIRHIYWKKFASRGEPVLKEHDSSTSPGLSLYLDVYNLHAENKTIAELEREDLSVEILTALVKYCLDNEIDIIVRAPCAPVFEFKGSTHDRFEEYYKQTINLFFGPYDSPVELFKVDMRNGLIGSKSVVFITHRLDPLLFNLLEESIHTDMRVMVVFNHTASDEEERIGNRGFFNILRDKGAVILEVHSRETMASDLESRANADVY
jgi:uncharacterized protein (DUF58 family)